MAEANLGLDGTKEYYTDDHKWQIIIGCTIFYVAAGLVTPGSIAFGVMLSKIEGRHPIWSFTTAVCGVFISLIIFFNCCAWIVAAYRPETGLMLSRRGTTGPGSRSCSAGSTCPSRCSRPAWWN